MSEDGRDTGSAVVIVTGVVRARPEHLKEAQALSVAHVHRSRGEPGCLAHGVYQDLEDPLRLVFVEEWADLAALRVHFAVPASRAFAAALRTLAGEPPAISIYQANPAQP